MFASSTYVCYIHDANLRFAQIDTKRLFPVVVKLPTKKKEKINAFLKINFILRIAQLVTALCGIPFNNSNLVILPR